LPDLEGTVVSYVKEKTPELLDQADHTFLRLKSDLTGRLDKLTEELKDEAPRYMEEHVTPFLAELKEKIPEAGKTAAEDINAEAPGIVAKVKERLINDAFPRLHTKGTELAKKLLSRATENMRDVLRQVTEQIVEDHGQTIKNMKDGELPETVAALMEERMGPVIDEFMPRVESTLANVRTDLRKLIGDHASVVVKVSEGTATDAERLQALEYRVLQLWKSLVLQLRAERTAAE